jgi:hypothetical protein
MEGLWNLRETFMRSEAVNFGLRVGAYQETLWTLPQLFYQNVEKDIVVDKSFNWCYPDNYELAKKISTHARFIVCYRPILEVLASFVSKSIDNPNFYLNKELDSSSIHAKEYLNRNDAMAEYLMVEHKLIQQTIAGLSHAKKNEDEGVFKFVAYDDLVRNPEQIMTEIFDFMKVEPMQIQTKNLTNFFKYQDSAIIGIDHFHHIRSQIKKESVKPEDLFSPFILQKYANALSPIGL